MEPSPEPTPVRARSSRPRLRDVAELAGVDISVASRVLRRAADITVRDETRERIVSAAASLGYIANPSASSLKTSKTWAIGLLLPDLANRAGAAIAAGAEEQAAAAGYLLVTATGPPRDRIAMLEGRVDGVIIASATSAPGSLPSPWNGGLPQLLMNRREPGDIPSIVVDDEAGARVATEYLLSIGHRRIGHVAGPQAADTARRRRQGFCDALREAGVQVRDAWIVEGPYDEAGGSNAAARILRESPPPTALLVSNLAASIGVMATARRLGLRVPADLSIVTFDDVALALYLDPPMTTIRLPLADLGRRAVDAMVAMINGSEQEDVMVDSPPELVLRQSCAPPPAE
jgi:LacI family transcriptional regulator